MSCILRHQGSDTVNRCKIKLLVARSFQNVQDQLMEINALARSAIILEEKISSFHQTKGKF